MPPSALWTIASAGAGLGKDLVVIGSGGAVDEFADDVGMAGVLRGLPDHPDEYCAERRRAVALIPVGYRPWRIKVESGDSQVRVLAGSVVETDDRLAGFLGRGPHPGIGIGLIPGRPGLRHQRRRRSYSRRPSSLDSSDCRVA